ncbi:DUF2809 domain-containing protein [Microbacterium sp. NPDC087591]|uniref:ribosomal maturation YjgA family protein n=1 Tax=Microbacterium sp. NPDC087591 TaxID=3364192 RepID=UPI0038137370
MTTDAAAPRTRRRLMLAGLAATTVGVGLLAHRSIDGVVGDVVGDALYAVLVYLLAAFVAPRARPLRSAVVAFTICAGIELFQLTALPRIWAAEFPPIRLALGTGFDPRDLVVYAVAVIAAAGVDEVIARRRVSRTSGNAAGRPPEGERPA